MKTMIKVLAVVFALAMVLTSCATNTPDTTTAEATTAAVATTAEATTAAATTAEATTAEATTAEVTTAEETTEVTTVATTEATNPVPDITIGEIGDKIPGGYKVGFLASAEGFAPIKAALNGVYCPDSVTVTIDDVTFKTSGGKTFGMASADYNPGYNSLGAMQIKSNKDEKGGYFYNTTAIDGVTTVVINFINTAETLDVAKCPRLYAGSTEIPADQITANEGTETISGVKTDVMDGSKSVYVYTLTFTVSDATFFKVSSGVNANYVISVYFA